MIQAQAMFSNRSADINAVALIDPKGLVCCCAKLIAWENAPCSASFDLVALVGPEGLVLFGAEFITSAWVQLCVALSNSFRVRIVILALTHKVSCHLDGSAANLDRRLVRGINMLRSEIATHAQSSLTSTSTQHWLAFNVDLLVDVDLRLPYELQGSCHASDAEETQEGNKLHCCHTSFARGSNS